MRTVRVNTSKAYEILIGEGILSQVGEEVKKRLNPCPSKVALISDDTVLAFYGDVVEKSLSEVGFATCTYAFQAGEERKNINTLSDVLEFLAQEEMTRGDLIVALGGGVVGDLAGFAAGIYQRGIDFVQIPTTFLAAVDSSVGGKTAIDLKAGKNMAGVFHQPKMVLCDTKTLETLPETIFADGVAEALKYGVIGNEELFEQVARGILKEDIPQIIETCVAMKRDIVVKDEFDHGERQLLNLGHTLGHSIEKCSQFTLSHGYAVAIGMHLIAKVAEARGIAERGTAQRICEALIQNGLPTETIFPVCAVAQGAGMDKKRRGEFITFIFPEKIGKCRLEKIPLGELEDLVEESMKSR